MLPTHLRFTPRGRVYNLQERMEAKDDAVHMGVPEEALMPLIINLTPHEVTLYYAHFTLSRIIVYPTLPVARVEATRTIVRILGDNPHHGFAITRTIFGAVTGLPDPAEGTIYIVSRLVVEASPQRADLYFPDDLIRNDKGVIVGARSLGVL